MSAEPGTEKTKHEPKSVPSEGRKPEHTLTRIPLRKVLWDKTMESLPGGSASMIHCGLPPENTNRPHYLADFIPAHQMIELRWYQGDNGEPATVLVPVHKSQQLWI